MDWRTVIQETLVSVSISDYILKGCSSLAILHTEFCTMLQYRNALCEVQRDTDRSNGMLTFIS